MRSLRPGAVAALLLAVAGVVLLASFDLFQISSAYAAKGDTYQIDLQLEHFKPVVAALPATARLGYVSDIDPASASGQALFFGAAYALAPRMVVGLERLKPGDLAVGNFSRAQDYAVFGAARGLQVVKDFGDGAVLFKKAAR